MRNIFGRLDEVGALSTWRGLKDLAFYFMLMPFSRKIFTTE
jgi:hypothetical protein